MKYCKRSVMSMSHSVKRTISIFGFEIVNDVLFLVNGITMNYSDILENG